MRRYQVLALLLVLGWSTGGYFRWLLLWFWSLLHPGAVIVM